ncbi:hypothetical protein PROFUN_07980 [Planoprotostelium fungivorum]|uniref:tRNA-guanine(15) transglycosylase-like domain-containing protein n=1 Tax=Planoprotostelium fungivorum TaxID=1890364 RepID=A0A2P6MV95_9EUKA|nr:hypothetical protein PROFUN_07980 [Planoprotostelium fungivorum]
MWSLKRAVTHLWLSSQSAARVGRIHTPHGVMDTPGFVPVATSGTVKGCDNLRLMEAGSQLIFCNTYHFLVHPGPKVVEDAGGLHKFINYKTGPIITDSGGFQIFSMSARKITNELKGKIPSKYECEIQTHRYLFDESNSASLISLNEKGATFRSYYDGELITLTPESSVMAQKQLGSDIIIPLDILPSIDNQDMMATFHRTHRWQERSLQTHKADPRGQAMYSVIHGGMDISLRNKSMDTLFEMPFDGHAVGGSIGSNRTESFDLLKAIMPRLTSTHKPVHLLGVGDTQSIGSMIGFGIDTFDSSYPTKIARTGRLLSEGGTIDISRSEFKSSHDEPIDRTCGCVACKNHSRAFLHHLNRMSELSFYTLATAHNVWKMNDYMRSLREKITRNEL